MPGGLFPNIQDVPIHIRGSYTRLGPVVPAACPRSSRVTLSRRSPRAADVANWRLGSRRSRTRSRRVIVNRVWQWHFGEGLVHTPNNFGLLSEPPTHPELLDWLAAQFVEDGWSLKNSTGGSCSPPPISGPVQCPAQHSTKIPKIAGSAAVFTPAVLEAEHSRCDDLVTGRLDPAPGGPAGPIWPPSRRSLYVQTARWDRSNSATLFDAANPDASVEKRDVSTIAPQSLAPHLGLRR